MSPRVTRRSAVQLGVASAWGLSLSGFLRAMDLSRGNASADSVIFVNLAGGVSHLDTLDMKPQGPAETRGEFQPIQTVIPGLVVCEHLPKLAQTIDQFTLIRGIHHSAGAHPQGQSWISTGNRPTPALLYPSYGSVVTKELPGAADLPGYVAIPKSEWNAGYMGAAYAPFKTNTVPQPGQPYQVRGVSLAEGVTLDQVHRRQRLLKQIDRTFRDESTNSQLLDALDRFSTQAHHIITSQRAQAAFSVEQEPESIRKRFTADELNQSFLLACRLIENGVRFVTVTNAGWDTHSDNFVGHKRLLGPLDNGLPALISTLAEKGLLERTLVVVMGEFGRTPKINENIGRDHFPRANCCLMAGGGVEAGRLIGSTNAAGDAASDDTDITPDDLAATLYHSLGINPRIEYHTTTGRPVMLVPEGRVLSEVFGS